MHSSLSQYLARWLSQKVTGGEITDIEFARLSHSHMTRLVFNSDGEEIRATTISSGQSQTIYRYCG